MHLVCTGMYAQAETELGPSCFFQEVDLVILLPHPRGCHVEGDFFFCGRDWRLDGGGLGSFSSEA